MIDGLLLAMNNTLLAFLPNNCMRFNKKEVSTKVTNLAGGLAFKESDKLEFVSILLTSFVNDQYYKNSNETIETVKGLIGKISDKKFIAKTALYARTKFGMRSVSHIVAGEIAKSVKGEKWTKPFFEKIVYRPDDITEILSYYMSNYGKPIPNSMKKGFRDVLSSLDAYKLAKYKGEGSALSMVDVVNLLHPASTEPLTALMKGTLKNTETWESKLSEAGKDEDADDAKGKAWNDLLREGKLGYFALLRNLRNILEQAPDVIDTALEQLVDEKRIKNSLVLPFRFTTALEQITQLSGCDTKLVRKTIVALNKAVDTSLANVPHLDGNTLVVLDVSGSMQGKPLEIGSLFTSVLAKANDADIMLFRDNAAYVNINPLDSTLSVTEALKAQSASGGTNFHAIFSEMSKAYDRVIILSDMQGWMGHDTPQKDFIAYKARFNCSPKVYSFDLAGHGTLQFPEKDVYCLAGFSDKIFDVMKLLETDKQALISEIEKTEL